MTALPLAVSEDADPQWMRRLTELGLDAHGIEPCLEYGALMLIAVLRLPQRVRLHMATTFIDFTNALEAMHKGQGEGI